MKPKPIIFNGLMTEKIRSNEKTQTRRLIKPQPVFHEDETGIPVLCDDGTFTFKIEQYANIYDGSVKPKYQKGDILYVPEAWRVVDRYADNSGFEVEFRDGKRASCIFDNTSRWEKFSKYIGKPGFQSPYFMPREAAQTFLRITDVRIERLCDISTTDAIAEGCEGVHCDHNGTWACPDCMNTGWIEPPQVEFTEVWNSTLKKEGFGQYDWNSNPWVIVYEFERIDKPEGGI